MCIVRRQVLKTKYNKRRETPLPSPHDSDRDNQNDRKILLAPPGQSLMDEDDTIRKPSDRSQKTTK